MAMKDSNENDSLTDNKFVTFYNYPEVTSNYNQEVNYWLSMAFVYTGK